MRTGRPKQPLILSLAFRDLPLAIISRVSAPGIRFTRAVSQLGQLRPGAVLKMFVPQPRSRCDMLMVS